MSARLWTERRTSAQSLGGRSGARLDGHTCPKCTEAVETVGAIGHGAMARSLRQHLRATGDRHGHGLGAWTDGAGEFDGLAAHAVTTAPPNSQPWEHVLIEE